MTIRVLVVEDEQIAAEAHRTYVERMPGFEVVEVARSFQDAARLLSSESVDLVLLDMNLPDGHGLDLLRRLRATGGLHDVIAVTSARDAEVVRQAVAHGVVAYLLKPFTFAMFEVKLRQYATFRATLGRDESVDQDAVDAVFGAMRPAPGDVPLPKGLSAETLEDVRRVLTSAAAGLSAGEVAELVGSSRVTARRYLEHLAEMGLLSRGTRYGGSGRPHVEYRSVSQ
ncbi:response regulator [Aeromicrobium stalagmiti]|uniref:response regulator n=1 Tax=Aeromicrobium stalagmiti TaxID=2738988 RepID=UPI001568609A|nr:response regulator [Aeromicrobium stalagmiti]NRQ48227.1 response regulator [Aeromicrobium stalagmiti]